jgi:hypothetical protein
VYAPWTPRLDVDTRWSVVGARDFELPLRRLETLMHDVLAAVLGREPERTTAEPATWRVRLRRRLSAFDEWEVVVALSPLEELSRVEVTVSFDASATRLGAVVWLSQSLVGLPLGLGWRAMSIHDARAYAGEVSRKLFAELGAYAGPAYR